MDAAIRHQTFHRDAGDFAADGIKARNDNGFRRVVDQDVDARGGFDRADVAAFAADDAAFHVFVGQRDRRRRAFIGAVAGVALHGVHHDLLRIRLELLLVLLLETADQRAAVLFQTFLQTRQQNVPRLVLRHARNAFQFLQLLLGFGGQRGLFVIQFLLTVAQLLVAAVKIRNTGLQLLHLLVDVVLFRRQTFFRTLKFTTAFGHFIVEFLFCGDTLFSRPVACLLRFQIRFFTNHVRFFFRLRLDGLRLLAGIFSQVAVNGHFPAENQAEDHGAYRKTYNSDANQQACTT